MFKKIFIHSPFRYLAALVIVILVSVAYLFTHNFTSPFNYAYALITGGIVSILIGGLSLVTFYGAFDTFRYAFLSMRRGENRKYEDLHQYVEIQNEQRGKKDLFYIPYLVVGLFFIIIGLILFLF